VFPANEKLPRTPKLRDYENYETTRFFNFQVLGLPNQITFKFTPSQSMGIVENGSFQILAPVGFVVKKRCPGFSSVTLPASTICRGSDRNYAALEFPDADPLSAGQQYAFTLNYENPSANFADASDNQWRFASVKPEGIELDTAVYAGFFMYPSDFAGFVVHPEKRLAGVTRVTVRFTPRTLMEGFVSVTAPLGVKWASPTVTNADLALDFSTDPEKTRATKLVVREPPLVKWGMTSDNTADNQLEMEILAKAAADFEYGFVANIVVPSKTPVPNRWWARLYTPPDIFKASAGTAGFRTKALMNPAVIPYNYVKEAWQNPTTIRFETTTAVKSEITPMGTVTVQAEFLLTAPEGFTFICPFRYPTKQTVPEGFLFLPDDAECHINHHDESERNKLHILLGNKGLLADTQYTFEVDLVNAATVNPTTNFYKMDTIVAGETVETAVLAGFLLAERMENTRYQPVGDYGGEDRRVGAYGNHVAFIMGTTSDLPKGTRMRIKAPYGFAFAPDCKPDIFHSVFAMGLNTQLFPPVFMCESMSKTGPELAYIADVWMGARMLKGEYAFVVKVQNPETQPFNNFWSLELFDPTLDTTGAAMAESWIEGFRLQEVLGAELHAHNPANAFPGEAAPNPVDVKFTLTSRLPPCALDPKNPTQCATTTLDEDGEAQAIDVNSLSRGVLLLVPPSGFFFPSVCRNFRFDAGLEGYSSLPENTQCTGGQTPELVSAYYRTGYPPFHDRYGSSDYLIGEDVVYEAFEETVPETIRFGPEKVIGLRVRNVTARGVAEDSRVRVGYTVSRVVRYPELQGEEKDRDYLDTLRALINDTALEKAGGVIANIDPRAITECLRTIQKEEPEITLEIFFRGPALVLTLPENTNLDPGRWDEELQRFEPRYAFRVLVENPAETFFDVDDLKRRWTIETRNGKVERVPGVALHMNQYRLQLPHSLENRLDVNYRVPSFAVYQRIRFFDLQSLNSIGLAETKLKFSVNINYDLAPQQVIAFHAPSTVKYLFKDEVQDSAFSPNEKLEVYYEELVEVSDAEGGDGARAAGVSHLTWRAVSKDRVKRVVEQYQGSTVLANGQRIGRRNSENRALQQLSGGSSGVSSVPDDDVIPFLPPTLRKWRRCLRMVETTVYREMDARFGESLIKDATTLPEHLECRVYPDAIRVVNTTPVRGGRPMNSGPTYEFLVEDVVNPNNTPALNLWRVVAETEVEGGQETWAQSGFPIYPELTHASVTSTNPARGLYTEFSVFLGDLGTSVTCREY